MHRFIELSCRWLNLATTFKKECMFRFLLEMKENTAMANFFPLIFLEQRISGAPVATMRAMEF